MAEANSSDTESFHNWSTNSRWLVFSSRRDDGLFSRPYFCHVDAGGHVAKPFMLPQRHPKEYYDESVYSFNTPDFTKAKVEFDSHEAGCEISSDKRIEVTVRP
jgi:hypothetical protein